MRDMIPKNIEGYRDADAGDLTLRELTAAEKECVQRQLKRLRAKPVVPIVLSVFMGTAMPLLLLYAVDEWTKEILTFMLIFSGFFYLMAFVSVKGRLKADAQVIGAQTGVVNGVWSYKKGKRNTRRYCMDVVFLGEKKRIKKVFCFKKDYEEVNQGDEVLVFTFTKAHAYGCRVKK